MAFVWTLFALSGFSLIWAFSKRDAEQFLIEVGRSYDSVLAMLPLKDLTVVIHGTGKSIAYRDVAEMIPRSCEDTWNKYPERNPLHKKACQLMDQFAQQYLTGMPLQGWAGGIPHQNVYIPGYGVQVPYCDAKAILPKYCQSHATEAVTPKCFKLEQSAATFLSTYRSYDVTRMPAQTHKGENGGPTYSQVEWMIPVVCEWSMEEPFWQLLSPHERSNGAALCELFYWHVVELLKAMAALPTDPSSSEGYQRMISFKVNNPMVTFKQAMPYIRPVCAKIEWGFYNAAIGEKIGEVRGLCKQIDLYA